MTVAAFALIVAAVAVMVLVHWLATSRLEERVVAREKALHDADEDRQLALYKQHKSAMQDVSRVSGIVERLAGEARHVHDDARLMHQRVDGFFADRRVQVMLDQGVSGRQPAHEEAAHGG